MQMRGIDVSKHNGTIDWNKVKISGVDFAIIRAGYGNTVSQKDQTFERNYAGATAAGLAVGAYWYSYAKTATDADREAAAFLQAIKGKKFNMPVFYDVEEENIFNSGITNQITDRFCTILENAGYWVGVYSSSAQFNKYFTAENKRKYTIWTAHWGVDHPAHPATYDIWQYSETGRVNGIDTNVDLNICYKNFPELIQKYNKNGYTSQEPAEGSQRPGQFTPDTITVSVEVAGKTYTGQLKGV